MQDTNTLYEVTHRNGPQGGRVVERFPFHDGVYGEARSNALDRAKALRQAGRYDVRVLRVHKVEVA